MKKTICLAIAVLMLASVFTACGKNKDASSSSSAPDSSSVSSSAAGPESLSAESTPASSMPEIVIDRNPYPGQTSMGGSALSLVMYSPGGEEEPPTITLTLQQQNNISQELFSVITKYESGEYPLERAEGDNSADFYPGWPNDIGFLKIVPVKQLIYSTVGHEVYPMSVQVPLAKGWFMECAMVVEGDDASNVDYASEDNYWVPAAAHFIDPYGLVHDAPGETGIEGGTTIVIS